MRTVMLLTVLGALALLGRDFAEERGFDPVGMLTGQVSNKEAAIELRCGGLEGAARSDCEFRLEARIEAGRVDPESVVRVYCTRVDNVWIQVAAPEPPPVCTERFGGWRTS